MKTKFLIKIFTVYFLLLAQGHALDVRMGLERGEKARMRLGIIVMKNNPSGNEKTAMGIMKADFAFEDNFSFEEVDYQAFSSAGLKELFPQKMLDALLTYSVGPGEEPRINASLFSADSDAPLFTRSYPGKSLRRNAHETVRDTVRYLAGEKALSCTRIVFTRKRGKIKEICIADYDGHNMRNLTGLNSISLSPKWFPDGEKILFTSYFDGNPDLYSVGTAGGKIETVSSVWGLNTTGSVHPSGKSAALTLSKDGNPEVYIKDLVSGRLTRITDNLMVDTSPSFAPNGNVLAFVSDRAGYPNIYTVNTDGTELKRISNKNMYNDNPVFSPDGTRLAYSVRSREGIDIWIYDFKAETEYSLTAGIGYNENPSWAPNGRWLVFAHKPSLYSAQRLLLLSADGARNIVISDREGDLSEPDWSGWSSQ